MTAGGHCLYALNQMLCLEGDGECRLAVGVPSLWKDYAFRLPAEGGYEVDCAVKGGSLARLVLRTRNPSAGKRVRLVLPDGTRRDVELSSPVVAIKCAAKMAALHAGGPRSCAAEKRRRGPLNAPRETFFIFFEKPPCAASGFLINYSPVRHPPGRSPVDAT